MSNFGIVHEKICGCDIREVYFFLFPHLLLYVVFLLIFCAINFVIALISVFATFVNCTTTMAIILSIYCD